MVPCSSVLLVTPSMWNEISDVKLPIAQEKSDLSCVKGVGLLGPQEEGMWGAPA